MNKRFVGYADVHRGRIQSLCVAEFDMDTLSEDENEALKEYEETGEGDEIFLDSLRPTLYHYAIDFSNKPPVIFINQSDPSGETWPSECGDTCKSLEGAIDSMLIDLGQYKVPVERAIVKVMMEKEEM